MYICINGKSVLKINIKLHFFALFSGIKYFSFNLKLLFIIHFIFKENCDTLF